MLKYTHETSICHVFTLTFNLLVEEITKLCVLSNLTTLIGSVVEWLKRRAYERHDLGSKPTRAILFCPWGRCFTAHSPAWWSWQAVINYILISFKLEADSNFLASPEAGWSNGLPYVLALPSLSCDSGGYIYRDIIHVNKNK